VTSSNAPTRLVCWQPDQDTLVALGTALAMLPVYYVGTHAPNDVVEYAVFVVGGNGALNVLFPAYYLLHVRRGDLADLGITRRRWRLALALSTGFSLLSAPGLAQVAREHRDVPIALTLIANGLLLWEPLFVHGWLQLRFERAFGMVPAIMLTGMSFAGYHVGSVSTPGVFALAGFGMVFASLFRLTRNLLTLWPLTWAVTGSIGTLSAGISFGWRQVLVYAALLIVQATAIRRLARGSA
jgi:hypothetical protein